MLERHEEIHKKEPVFKCLDCDDCFTDRSRLNEHVQNKHPECNPYECNICGKRFSCFDSRNKHYRCHSENEYKCSICDCSFNTLCSYNRHLKCHEKYRTERYYGCFYCEDSFTDLFSLRNHINISHENHRTNKNNSKFYKCPKCIWSGGVSTLWDHYEDKHSTEIEKEDYKCNYCEDKFTVRKEYEKHLQGHTMESLPYTCKYCTKKFRSPTLCAQHILDAHGEKLELNVDDRVTKLERLVIEICDFESELDPDFQRNKEGQLVFICKQCGNRWYGCTALKMHYKLSKDCKQGQPPGSGEQETNDLVEVNQKLSSPQQMKMKDNEESDMSKLQFQEKDVDHHNNSVLYKEDINATFEQTSSHSVNHLNRNIVS